MNALLTEPTKTAPINTNAAAFAWQTRTVLVVDDYPSFCEVAAATLRRAGYHVLTSVDAEAALRLALNSDSIDLLLTDVEMPRMRGEELASWFQTERPGTPVLFMSGADKVRTSQPYHFLQKPFRAEELISKVREALEQTSCGFPETTPA